MRTLGTTILSHVMRVRMRELESLFQNSIKQLEFVSVRIKSVNAERRLSAVVKAILKDYVTKLLSNMFTVYPYLFL